MRERLIGPVVLAVSMATACDSPPSASEPMRDVPSAVGTSATTTAPSASVVASTTSSPSAVSPPEVQTGLRAPDNDAEVVKEIEKVRKGCKWKGDESVGPCPLMHEWVEWVAWPGRREVKPTLAAILQDDDPAVRHMAAVGLEVIGSSPIRDTKLATALFDALASERRSKNCRGVAQQAGTVRLAETKLDARAVDIAKSHPIPLCRQEFVSAMIGGNPQHYDLAVTLAKTDTDMAVRRAAMGAMRAGAKEAERQAQNCKIWIGLIGHDELRNRVVELVGGTGIRATGAPCVEEWDAMLDHVERALGDGSAPSNVSTWGIAAMVEQKRATDKQRSKGIAICKRVVENTHNKEMRRADALGACVARSPDAKAFAKKFEADSSKTVAKYAKRILDKD